MSEYGLPENRVISRLKPNSDILGRDGFLLFVAVKRRITTEQFNYHNWPWPRFFRFCLIFTDIHSEYFSHWEVMTRRLIFYGFCFWLEGFALWCKGSFFDLLWNLTLFDCLIFSKVPPGSECDGFLQCFVTLGPQPRMSNELDGFCLCPLQLQIQVPDNKVLFTPKTCAVQDFAVRCSERQVFLRLAISFRLISKFFMT